MSRQILELDLQNVLAIKKRSAHQKPKYKKCKSSFYIIFLLEPDKNFILFYCSGTSRMWSSYDNRCSRTELATAHARSNATRSPSHPALRRRAVAIRSQSSRKEKAVRFISRQSVRWNGLRAWWQWYLLEWRIYWRVSKSFKLNIIAFNF